VGDYNADVVAHRVIPEALRLAGAHMDQTEVAFDWKHTSAIGSLAEYHGVWCVPASPYADEAAAVRAIQWARENKVPFLGTCGGFQHAVLELARHVLGLSEAQHAETAASEDCLWISRLACSLVEVDRPVFATPQGAWLTAAYGSEEIPATYHCNFGFNPHFEADLERAGVQVMARDEEGEVRAIQLKGHPFFVGTLFQPERMALKGEASPIVNAFVGRRRITSPELLPQLWARNSRRNGAA
jgi:CTP synthase (UTP-ammonia lyase)